MQEQKIVLYIRHEKKIPGTDKTDAVISEVDVKFDTEEQAIAWANENTQNTNERTFYYRVQPWTKTTSQPIEENAS